MKVKKAIGRVEERGDGKLSEINTQDDLAG